MGSATPLRLAQNDGEGSRRMTKSALRLFVHRQGPVHAVLGPAVPQVGPRADRVAAGVLVDGPDPPVVGGQADVCHVVAQFLRRRLVADSAQAWPPPENRPSTQSAHQPHADGHYPGPRDRREWQHQELPLLTELPTP